MQGSRKAPYFYREVIIDSFFGELYIVIRGYIVSGLRFGRMSWGF